MQKMWLAIGWLFMSVAIVGIALPIMPTVPFLLIAAWAFARSSPRLRQRILDHPSYGHHVRAWQERGAVSRAAKLWAIATMTGGVALSVYLQLPPLVVAVQAAICCCVALFLITRPSP